MIHSDIKSQLYIDHIVLTVSDIIRTKNFYSKIFGSPDHQDEYSIMYSVGETRLFFALSYGELQRGDKFSPNRIGLEHLAIGVRTLDDLKEIESALNKNDTKNSGIHIDKHSNKEKIWLNDPDGIRIEFYIRPKAS